MVPTKNELSSEGRKCDGGYVEDHQGVEELDDKEIMALLAKRIYLSKIRATLAMVAAACVVAALVSSC